MIIGITGTDGAGKGTAVTHLKTKGFVHYSSRDFIVAEIKKRDLPASRNQMRLTANELRAKHGNEFVIKQAYEKAQAERATDVIIESVRALAEAEYLKAHGGILLAIDADPKLRYERVQGRRSATDQVTYEQFIEHEELEKNDPDPNGMQKAAVMAMADYTIVNNDSPRALQNKLDEWLARIEA